MGTYLNPSPVDMREISEGIKLITVDLTKRIIQSRYLTDAQQRFNWILVGQIAAVDAIGRTFAGIADHTEETKEPINLDLMSEAFYHALIEAMNDVM